MKTLLLIKKNESLTNIVHLFANNYFVNCSQNKVDMLHVRLTELHAVHQNLPCHLLT